jgi:replicative DNA helicase
VTACPTGFVELDEMTSGFQKSDLVIVAARPSMGKTSLVLNMALHAAIEAAKCVGVFSLEMSKEQLFMRMLTVRGARGRAPLPRAGSSASRTTTGSWRRSHGCTTPRCSSTTRRRPGLLEMRAKSRRLKMEHGLDMIVVDYLQLMQGAGGSRAASRNWPRSRARSRFWQRSSRCRSSRSVS